MIKREEDDREPSTWKLLYIVVLSVILVVVVSISKIRSEKSQSSPSTVGFQHSSRRSTMDIVNSCISTMIICAISVMHFNIPKSTAHRLNFWEKIKSPDFWAEAWNSVSHWFVGLLVPEVLVLLSCAEYYIALRDCVIMQHLCPDSRWTLQHSFFALMGGYALEDGDSIRSGQELYERGAILSKKACEGYTYEINDKAKANVLTKAIAILQISRFLLEEIDRACNGLPISPLEYFTCAQVFAALFMYVYWLEKPHGVRERIKVDKGQERPTIAENFKFESMISAFTITTLQRTDTSVKLRVFIQERSRKFFMGGYAALLIAASALSSWNEPFPSRGVRILWKVASVGSAVCPIVAIIGYLQEDILGKDYSLHTSGPRLVRFVYRYIKIVVPDTDMGRAISIYLLLHIGFRIILIVLIFLSFRNMPPEVYETRGWLAFFPSFH